MTPELLKTLAEKYEWKLHCLQNEIGMISFVKIFNGDKARINIYMTKMTVATCINHPKKGKTQLFRKKVNLALMEKIFKNPRVHTKKGFRFK